MTDVALTDPDELYNERVDRLIWKYIGVKSVRDIAKETGLTPEQVLRRKSELIDSVDVLTVQQKRTKILISLERLAQDAIERAEGTDDEFYAGMLNAARGSWKDILTELRRVDKNEQEAVNTLNNMRIRELVSLVQDAVNASVPEIAERYGLEESDLFDIFNANLTRAAERRDAQ